MLDVPSFLRKAEDWLQCVCVWVSGCLSSPVFSLVLMPFLRAVMPLTIGSIDDIQVTGVAMRAEGEIHGFRVKVSECMCMSDK